MNVAISEPVATPTRKTSARQIAHYFLFTLAASLYLLPFMRLIQQRTDEGIFLSGAVRIVHGQLFSRDFLEMVGPGTFYWLAGFFRFFGVSFFAARVDLFISSLATCVALYYLSRRICPKYQLVPCIVVLATYYGSVWPAVSHHTDSNCLVFLTIACILLWQDKQWSILLFVAGALAGLTAFIHLQKGLLLLLAVLVWLWIQSRRKAASPSSLALVWAGSLSAAVPVLSYFWSRGALGSLVYANVLWPLQHYESANIVPYAHGIFQDYWNHWASAGVNQSFMPAVASLLIVPFLFVAALPLLLIILGACYKTNGTNPEILLYWLCGVALWCSEMQRKDIVHLAFGSPLLMILCIYYMSKTRGKAGRYAVQILAISSVCLATFNVFLVLTAQPVVTRVGKVAMFGKDPVLKALEEHVSPGDELFIYPYCPTYYFLLSAMNPTHYSFLHNGSTTAEFQSVINELDEHKVRIVAWDTTFESRVVPANFPRAARMPPGRLLIENYLNSHYTLLTEVDGFRILERRKENHAE